jgi:hypothetical protein
MNQLQPINFKVDPHSFRVMPDDDLAQSSLWCILTIPSLYMLFCSSIHFCGVLSIEFGQVTEVMLDANFKICATISTGQLFSSEDLLKLL